MAREIAGGKYRREQEARDNEPRKTGRQFHGPRDCVDRHEIVVFAHGAVAERLRRMAKMRLDEGGQGASRDATLAALKGFSGNSDERTMAFGPRSAPPRHPAVMLAGRTRRRARRLWQIRVSLTPCRGRSGKV